MKKLLIFIASFVSLLALVSFVSPSVVSAHCDTLDGPVVSAARKAMETDNVNYILIWVKPEAEDEIRKALKRAQNKKKAAKTKKEKDKAEMELFEILVRIHREGEGAKYEGVKPAGTIEPEIALADKAVVTGKLGGVLAHIKSEHKKEIIRHLFHALQGKSGYDINNVVAGREFVEAYVTLIHTVEAVIKGHAVSEAAHHHH